MDDKKEVVGKLLDLMAKEERPDSIEFGTPSKGGAIKIYGDFRDPEGFKKLIDNAFAVRAYAAKKIEEIK
jgi:hypothetical protein